MTNHSVLILDLALTQALEQYQDMSPREAQSAILYDWPEQIAVLLFEFLFKTWCRSCGEHVDFITTGRRDGYTTYIRPFCDCELLDLEGDEA